MNRVLSYVQSGSEEGAELRLGGGRARQDSGGFYVEPTIFGAARNDMKIAREEIFGPVLTAIPFGSEEEGLRIANDTVFGLSAGVWTSDINKALRFARSIRAGSVCVNCYDYGDNSLPFGGYKQSGIGRDKSLHALENYTQLKMTYINVLDD
jgi:gamma-glutamyl-gamma-aminobutyraldehyde dehydrogenase/4-guanidinobutyraldehyde dehydrogenase/NAD-dependent aldehyde dehydrogenase